MEWVGIPSVAIVHEALAGSADAMKKMSRMPDYPYVKIPYPTQPTGIWPDSDLLHVAGMHRRSGFQTLEMA